VAAPRRVRDWKATRYARPLFGFFRVHCADQAFASEARAHGALRVRRAAPEAIAKRLVATL
jgi:hypothetical protein